MGARSIEHHLSRRVRDALAEAGFEFERRNRHIIYKHRETGQILTFSYTSRDRNKEHTMLNQIRRAKEQGR